MHFTAADFISNMRAIQGSIKNKKKINCWLNLISKSNCNANIYYPGGGVSII